MLTPPDPRRILLLTAIAARSSCRKSQRGALLVTADGREFWGSNRPASGTCDGSDACRRDCAKICVHAEQDVLIQAGVQASGAHVVHLKVVDCRPVVSGDPSCVECSKLMLAAGVARVWLYQVDGWRSWTAAEFHAATLKNLGLRGQG